MNRLPKIVIISVFTFCLQACSPDRQTPPENALMSPNNLFWVELENNSPTSDERSDQNLHLAGLKHQEKLPLLLGIENMCDTQARWLDAKNLMLSLPQFQLPYLKTKAGTKWQGVTIHIEVHQRQVKFSKTSPSRNQRLVVIEDCQKTHWKLYLRDADAPTYSYLEQDPNLLVQGEWLRPVLALKWLDEETAELIVGGNPKLTHAVQPVAQDKLKLNVKYEDKVPDSFASEPIPASVNIAEKIDAPFQYKAEHLDGDRYIDYERLDNGKTRIWYAFKSREEKLLLIDEVESLEDLRIWWIRENELAMEIPYSLYENVKVSAQQNWNGTLLSISFHNWNK